MEASAQLKHVELSLIEVSGANPRKDLKGETFKELKQSIAEHGILEPLIVRPKGKGYELVAGERRLTAAKELKLETVPVAIRELDDHTARVLMLLEEAAALEELLKDTGDGGMTQEEFAKKLSKSQPWVANRLRLNKAPAEMKKLLVDGKISAQHVVTLMPYVERKQLKAEILQGIKIKLEEQEYEGPFTVGQAKDMAEDILEEYGMDLSLNDYNHQGLKKSFDFSLCETCDKIMKLVGEDSKEKTRRMCLDKLCFTSHIGKAREKFDAGQKEKISKSEVIKTDKLEYGSYVEFDGYNKPTFDTTACKECPNHKMVKPRYAKFGKDKDELEEVCLKPGCYRGKQAQVSRVKNKTVREELAFADKSLDTYLATRSKGFTAEELKYVLSRVIEIVPHTYGRGDDVIRIRRLKDDVPLIHENSVLRLLVLNQLGPIRYGLDMVDLKDAEKGWPFKVSREKALEPPKTKKVQEKRKKKGAV